MDVGIRVIKYSASKIIPFGFSFDPIPLMLLEELQYILLQKKITLDFALYINPIRPEGVFFTLLLGFFSVILEPQMLFS